MKKKRTGKLPDIVSADEIEDAVLKTLARRFTGRTLEIGMLSLGLTFALAKLKQLALQEAKRKGSK